MTLVSRLLLAGLLSAASLARAGAGTPSKPNIVVILADDIGSGDIRALNPVRGKIPTPCLDRLVAEGTAFTDAHSGASVCTPTRYGLLKGRYAWRTRLQKGVLDGAAAPLIAADRPTVAGFLRGHGYPTACVGMWHLGYHFERAGKGDTVSVGSRVPDGPTTRGFDHFYGFRHAREMKNLVEDDRLVAHVAPIDMLPRLVRRAVAYVGERAESGKPFFLYLALNSPHTPIAPAAEWKGRSGLNPYADYVMQTDAAVGEVLRALDDRRLSGDTLVVFTSDNGCSPEADTDRLEKLGHFASGRFRGYKSDIWDGGHRVTFVARWPGRVRAAGTSDQLVCLTDLIATVADVLGT